MMTRIKKNIFNQQKILLNNNLFLKYIEQLEEMLKKDMREDVKDILWTEIHQDLNTEYFLEELKDSIELFLEYSNNSVSQKPGRVNGQYGQMNVTKNLVLALKKTIVDIIESYRNDSDGFEDDEENDDSKDLVDQPSQGKGVITKALNKQDIFFLKEQIRCFETNLMPFLNVDSVHNPLSNPNRSTVPSKAWSLFKGVVVPTGFSGVAVGGLCALFRVSLGVSLIVGAMIAFLVLALSSFRLIRAQQQVALVQT